MPVTERLMAAGQFSLKLRPETPKKVRDVVDFFGHVFVFDSPQRSGQGDATMITAARWGGIVRRRGPTNWDVAGVNLIGWLGDEDQKGPFLESALTRTSNTFAQWANAVLSVAPATVNAGALTAGGVTVSATYQWVTKRQVIDNLAAICGFEYRVTNRAGSFWFDADTVGGTSGGPGGTGLFVQTPKAFAVRASSGRDLNVVGLELKQLDVSIDAEEYFTRQVIKDSTGAYTVAGGSASPYKDIGGNTVVWDKLTTSSLTPNASAAGLAANLVAAGEVLRNEIALTTIEYDIDRDVQVGDFIGVYDPDSNMVDSTKPVHYRGSTIYPIQVRVLAITWPIEEGMGIWYRDRNGAWTDLTRFVIYEPAGATFEVGAAQRATLTRDQWDKLHS